MSIDKWDFSVQHVLWEGFLLGGLAACDKVTLPRPTVLQHTAACCSSKTFPFRSLVLAVSHTIGVGKGSFTDEGEHAT